MRPTAAGATPARVGYWGLGAPAVAKFRGVPTIKLQAEVASAPVARRWLVHQLFGFPEDLVDAAILLTSELVANAVLHAGTPSMVSLHHFSDRIRIGVVDANPTLPAYKEYGTSAVTGRGLTLLDKVATTWGTTALPGGKVVWFELELAGARQESGPDPGPQDWPMPSWLAGPAPAPGERRAVKRVPVVLKGIPLELLLATSEHYDALAREFRLIVERDRTRRGVLPGQLLALIEEIGPRWAAFSEATADRRREAVARQEPVFDLFCAVPSDSGPYCAELDRLLEESDAYCESAELITLPPSPDCASLRKWLLNEFVRQADGAEPIAWHDSTWAHPLPPGAEGLKEVSGQ